MSMTMRTSLVLLSLCGSALSFGGSGTTLDACDRCLCDNTEADPEDGTKKCCSTEDDPGILPFGWDSFCDALSLDVCKAVCANAAGASTITRMSFSLRSTGQGTAGSPCGQMLASGAGVCNTGLVCTPHSYVFAGYAICTSTSPYYVPTMPSTGISSEAQSKADALENMGIELLAFDWDKTANQHHTFQQMYESYEQIAGTISDDFVSLASAWCGKGKPVAIVTYNDAWGRVDGAPVRGPDMIRTVLGMVNLPATGCNIPVYAENLSHTRNLGKNPLLLQAQTAVGVSDSQVMLIDDTRNNIDQVALNNKGYYTTWVEPDMGFEFFNMY